MNTVKVNAPEFIKTLRSIQKLASDVATLQFIPDGEAKLKIRANGLPAFAFAEIPLAVKGLIEQPFAIRCPNSRLSHMLKAKGWKQSGTIQLNLSGNYLLLSHLDLQLQLEIPVTTDLELFDGYDTSVRKEVMTLDGATFKTIIAFLSPAMVRPSDQRLPHTHPAVAISVYPRAKHFVAIASDSYRMHYVTSRLFWSTFAQETSRLLSNEGLQQIFIDPDPLRNILSFLDNLPVHFYELFESSLLHIEQGDKKFTLPVLLSHKHNYTLKFAQELPQMQVVGESSLQALPTFDNEWLVFLPANSDTTEVWTFSSNSEISGPHFLPGRWFVSRDEDELWSCQVRFFRDAWRAFRKQHIESVQIAYHSDHRSLHISASNEIFEFGAYIAPGRTINIPLHISSKINERKNEMMTQKSVVTDTISSTKKTPKTRKWKAVFRNIVLKFNSNSPQPGWTVYVVNYPEMKTTGVTPVDAYQKIAPKLSLFYVSERHEKWDDSGTLTIHWKRPNRELFLTKLGTGQYVFSHVEEGRIFFGGGATAKEAYKNALSKKRSIECTTYSLHEQVLYLLQATQNYEQFQTAKTPKVEDELLLEKLVQRLSGLHGYFKRELLSVTNWEDFDKGMLRIASICLERDHWFRLYTAERNRVDEIKRAYGAIEEAAKAFGFAYVPVKGTMEGS